MITLPLLDALAEARIEEAMREGAFDDLPGSGRPLVLDDESLIPEELRAAYRILRNAGFVPPEVEARHERKTLAALIATLDDGDAKRRALTKLALLEAWLDASSSGLRYDRSYDCQLVERFGAR
jgi:hypothetical protein